MQGSKAIHTGDFCSTEHLLISGKRCSQHQVLFEGAVEQDRVLGYIAHGPTQIDGIYLAAIHSINQHTTLGRLVQAQHQTGNGSFPAANTANNTDALPGRNPEVNAIEHKLTRFWITKLDLLELNFTF